MCITSPPTIQIINFALMKHNNSGVISLLITLRTLGPTFLNILTPNGIGIATGYGLDGPGSISGSARFFCSPQRPERLWGPPSLPLNGHPRLFPRGKMAGAWSWIFSHLHPVPRSRKVELYLQSPMFSWRSAQLIKHKDKFVSRDSSFGIAAGYGLDDQGEREFESR
jgi:hypothetical protein